VVCTPLGRILYISPIYPGKLDDTKALEWVGHGGENFNNIMLQKYHPNLAEPFTMLGDKGFFIYTSQ
jgi:hypothetical protein